MRWSGKLNSSYKGHRTRSDVEKHPVRSLRNLPGGLVQIIFRYRRPGIPTASGSQFGTRATLTLAASGQDQAEQGTAVNSQISSEILKQIGVVAAGSVVSEWADDFKSRK